MPSSPGRWLHTEGQVSETKTGFPFLRGRAALRPLRSFGAGRGPVQPGRGRHEIRQQTPRPPRRTRSGRVPIARRSGAGSFLQHPSRKQRQCGFLHHLVQEDRQFLPQIGHVFELGHFKVAKRRAGTLAKILHGRTCKTRHLDSPGASLEVIGPISPVIVTESRFCTSSIWAVENLAGHNSGSALWPASQARFGTSTHVQRM